ncbi:hypothetical protein CBW65_11800 [Tumebacillus avium]|uniref:DUF6602 domain-containing protein n=1 Tax=Tumebacillus avium TaxID=1903704 RepID=A0A1Y0IMZ4_9BACL|nr:DUF6602 domain-containing protein [Tumebacillus avium]ARU61620.1 hypothetical protein CBW65_11800 [Tumebacillus avium]
MAEFLQEKLPEKFGAVQGQIFSLDGTAADESDVVLYDRLHTPKLSAGKRMLIPAETAGAALQTLEALTAGLLVEEARQLREVRRLQKVTKKGFTGGLELISAHPYTLGVIVARTSELSLEEIAETLNGEQAAWPLPERVSAVFVLDVGLVVYQTPATGEVRYFPLDGSELGTVAAGADTLAFLLLYLSSYLNSIEVIAPDLMPLLAQRF